MIVSVSTRLNRQFFRCEYQLQPKPALTTIPYPHACIHNSPPGWTRTKICTAQKSKNTKRSDLLMVLSFPLLLWLIIYYYYEKVKHPGVSVTIQAGWRAWSPLHSPKDVPDLIYVIICIYLYVQDVLLFSPPGYRRSHQGADGVSLHDAGLQRVCATNQIRSAGLPLWRGGVLCADLEAQSGR